MAEIMTRTLSDDELLLQLAHFPDLLSKLKVGSLRVKYGWACNVPSNDQYKWIEISISEVSTFISTSQSSGAYQAGSSDLVFSDGDERVEITFCHESDVHAVTARDEVIASVKAQWKGYGLVGYERSSEGAEWSDW